MALKTTSQNQPTKSKEPHMGIVLKINNNQRKTIQEQNLEPTPRHPWLRTSWHPSAEQSGLLMAQQDANSPCFALGQRAQTERPDMSRQRATWEERERVSPFKRAVAKFIEVLSAHRCCHQFQCNWWVLLNFQSKIVINQKEPGKPKDERRINGRLQTRNFNIQTLTGISVIFPENTCLDPARVPFI